MQKNTHTAQRPGRASSDARPPTPMVTDDAVRFFNNGVELTRGEAEALRDHLGLRQPLRARARRDHLPVPGEVVGHQRRRHMFLAGGGKPVPAAAERFVYLPTHAPRPERIAKVVEMQRRVRVLEARADSWLPHRQPAPPPARPGGARTPAAKTGGAGGGRMLRPAYAIGDGHDRARGSRPNSPRGPPRAAPPMRASRRPTPHRAAGAPTAVDKWRHMRGLQPLRA